MDNELEVIRDEMEQTRANLAEKLGALENQVRETVSGATEAVSSTVEGVKGVVSTVSETVETVTDKFNVTKQVEQHPWMAVGAAFATGFVIAQVLGRSGSQQGFPAHLAAPTPHTPSPTQDLPLQPLAHSPAAAAQQHQPPHRAAEQKDESGLMDSLKSMMPDLSGVTNTLVSSLGGLAIGSVMGVIRELASSGLPDEWKGEVTKLVDQVATQLGGKPLDPTRSNQLLAALGLGGDQDGQSQSAPHDAARQQQQAGHRAGDGTHGRSPFQG